MLWCKITSDHRDKRENSRELHIMARWSKKEPICIPFISISINTAQPNQTGFRFLAFCFYSKSYWKSSSSEWSKKGKINTLRPSFQNKSKNQWVFRDTCFWSCLKYQKYGHKCLVVLECFEKYLIRFWKQESNLWGNQTMARVLSSI